MSPAPDLEQLLAWLAIDSTTGSERTFLERLEHDLHAEGLRCERQPVAPDRWNLIARPTGPCQLLFSTHVDTVPPFFGPRREGEATRARGACDTKGGLFAMLAAWRGLPAALRQHVGFLLVVGEEVDHCGAIAAADLSFPDLRAIVLCEPTCNRIALGQKGILKLRVSASGRAGHSAFPEAGHSAVHPLVRTLARWLDHTWPDDPDLGPTTLNVGLIGGGIAANVHAPDASAEVLFRTVRPAAQMRDEVARVTPSDVLVEEISANDPVRLTPVEGFATTVIPFNTDAPWLQQLAPTVLYGPGDIRTAHCADEILTDRDLLAGIADYGAIAAALLEADGSAGQ